MIPPPRPSTVPQALQNQMPLTDVLNLISKPPGSGSPFIPYKPVPYLVPLPSRHTLVVSNPTNARDESAFGDLRQDNLQLVILVSVCGSVDFEFEFSREVHAEFAHFVPYPDD